MASWTRAESPKCDSLGSARSAQPQVANQNRPPSCKDGTRRSFAVAVLHRPDRPRKQINRIRETTDSAHRTDDIRLREGYHPGKSSWNHEKNEIHEKSKIYRPSAIHQPGDGHDCSISFFFHVFRKFRFENTIHSTPDPAHALQAEASCGPKAEGTGIFRLRPAMRLGVEWSKK
jgi:hypothetical protein